jgi:hypothetical protein
VACAKYEKALRYMREYTEVRPERVKAKGR